MKSEEREALIQELLEYHYGCHEEPQRIRQRIENEPEIAELYEEARRTAEVLDDAARLPTPPLDLKAPRARRLFPTFLRIAASIALLVNAIALGNWGVQSWQRSEHRDDQLRLVVSGPPAMPEAVTSAYRVETFGAGGRVTPASLSWSVLDGEDQEIAQGSSETEGALSIALEPRLAAARKLVVRAQRDDVAEETTMPLVPGVGNPLIHVETDKPIYRPGEIVFLRGLAINRISLEPIDRRLHLRVVNPKDNAMADFRPLTDQGVVGASWLVPDDAAGGRYAIEVRAADDSCALARQEFTVRRFERPMLRKTIVLDRESYAPGATGQAEVTVERLAGGPAEGAGIEAFLVIDGETSPVGEARADAGGRAIFVFAIPDEVRVGDARLVARIEDGGRVETQLRPFLVPTGAYDVAFYPEGGEMQPGENRVYFESLDPLGRPVALSGKIVDQDDREIAVVRSRHQGRGLVVFDASTDARYRLIAADAKSFELPQVVAGAVGLDTRDFEASPDGRAGLRIDVPDDGPFVVGLFCRGFLVASQTFEGAGLHEIDLDLRDEIEGVLRVTVFDHELNPRAERLVHRRGSRRIEVEMTAAEGETMPGSRQTIKLRARDEEGRPVKAILGITVSDQAVRDLAGEYALGIADSLTLTADVEALEEVETFLVGPEAEAHIDLLLGTRGWRRFAWKDPAAAIERDGDRARTMLARESRAHYPRIAETRNYDPAEVQLVQRDYRRARESGASTLALSLFALIVIGLSRLGWKIAPRGLSARIAGAVVVPVLGCALLIVVTFPNMSGGGVGEDMMVAERAFAPQAALEFDPMEVPAHELMDEAAFDDLNEEIAIAELLRDNAARREAEGRLRLGMAGEAAALAVFGEEGEPVEDPVMIDEEVADQDDFEAEEIDGVFKNPEYARKRRLELRNWVREYAHVHRSPAGQRIDFSETVYWNAMLQTDERGLAEVSFDLSDSVTTWTARVNAHGAGRVGQAELRFDSVLPLTADLMAPIEISSGDRYQLPITVSSRLVGEDGVEVEILEIKGGLRRLGPERFTIDLDSGRGRAYLALEAGDDSGEAEIRLAVSCGVERDEITRRVRITRRGFPHRVSRSGMLEGGAEIAFATPTDCLAGSLSADLVVYPSALSILQQGLEGMLREPYGCFEQTSSVNYPNVMALRLMETTRMASPAVAARARGLIEKGYAKLVSFECSKRGYEWFGGDPGHEALTAYGLLEFHDMKAFVSVDEAMMNRTRAWLMDRRDGKGGYQRNDRALDSFGRAPKETTDAYVTYALACTGTKPELIGRELDRLAERAQESNDAYEVALAASALQAAGRLIEADGARERLKQMQAADGGLVGKDTITRSGARDRAVETTAFAVLAFLDDPDDMAYALNALRFLLGHADGGGCFGSTQATVMALRALSSFAEKEMDGDSGGELRVLLNGEEIARKTISGDAVRPLILSGLADRLRPGENVIRLEGPADMKLPWAFDLGYFAEKPADDPNCAVALSLTMTTPRVRWGETAAIRVKVTNRRGDGLPMTMVAVGLPGNLEVPTSVLEDLKKAGRFDFWEIRGRDLFFYWRDMAPETSEVFMLDCVAKTPGLARGAASRAWLYYAPQETTWHRPIEVEVVAD